MIKQNFYNSLRVPGMIVIVLLGFGVYVNTLDNPFVWDDEVLIKKNPQLQKSVPVLTYFQGNLADYDMDSPFYRPLQMLSYKIDSMLWRLNPLGFHLTNILLHIAVAIGLFVFVFNLFKDMLVALIAGILFVVHPIHTEAVAYISGRADSLMTLFLIMTFVFYLRYEQSGKRYDLLWMMLSFSLACFSKEHALIILALIPAYHFAFSRRLVELPYAFLWVISALYIFLRFKGGIFVPNPIQTTFLERLPGVFVSFYQYLKLLLVPTGLHMGYGHATFSFGDIRFWAGFSLFFLMIFYGFKMRKQSIIVFSILWFLIALLPTQSVFYPMNAYMAEHWLYLPSMGFFVLAAFLLKKVAEASGKFPAGFIAVILIIFLSLLTVKQNQVWAEPMTLFQRVLKYNPDYPEAHLGLGIQFSAAGKSDIARDHYEKALALRPHYSEAHNNLGVILAKEGKIKQAGEHFLDALRVDPNNADAHTNVGRIFALRGDEEQALYHYAEALKLRPGHEKALNNLALLYAEKGEVDEAIRRAEEAMKTRPRFAAAYNTMGFIYASTGDYDKALSYYTQASLREPGNLDALSGAAVVLALQGEYKKAETLFLEILDKNPEYPDARERLGQVRQMRQTRQADDQT